MQKFANNPFSVSSHILERIDAGITLASFSPAKVMPAIS